MIWNGQFVKSDDFDDGLKNIQEIICPKRGTITPAEPIFDDFYECLTCGTVFSALKPNV